MLLIDAVYAVEADVSIVAVKNVTANEPCYASLPDDIGPHQLAYPCSLIMESCGQAGGILWAYSGQLRGRDVTGLPLFVSGRECVFEADVLPGDTMEHRVCLERVVADAIFMSGETWVGQRRVAKMGWLSAVIRPLDTLRQLRVQP